MVARVFITLKEGVLDPAGQAVERSLHAMGYPEVGGVRLGKYIELSVADDDAARVKERVEEMCRKLLANTVVERFRVEVG